jgi:acyl-CoA hydrolase
MSLNKAMKISLESVQEIVSSPKKRRRSSCNKNEERGTKRRIPNKKVNRTIITETNEADDTILETHSSLSSEKTTIPSERYNIEDSSNDIPDSSTNLEATNNNDQGSKG